MFISNMLYNIATSHFTTFTQVFHTQYNISHYTYSSNLILKIVDMLNSKHIQNKTKYWEAYQNPNSCSSVFPQ